VAQHSYSVTQTVDPPVTTPILNRLLSFTEQDTTHFGIGLVLL